MPISTCYNTFFNVSLHTQHQILPRCRSLKAEDICGEISAAIFFSWYRHRFCGHKLKYLSRWCLDIWSFIDEVLGIYPIWKIYILFLPSLDGSASIIRPKKSMNFSIKLFSLLKWAHNFPFLVQHV